MWIGFRTRHRNTQWLLEAIDHDELVERFKLAKLIAKTKAA